VLPLLLLKSHIPVPLLTDFLNLLRLQPGLGITCFWKLLLTPELPSLTPTMSFWMIYPPEESLHCSKITFFYTSFLSVNCSLHKDGAMFHSFLHPQSLASCLESSKHSIHV
jgi:hypothetical protein